ncbi:hypothetical protein RYX36_001977 [Vicia faba]
MVADWLIRLMLSYLRYESDQVSRLGKEGTRKTTLAIGDGANDVGMIQEVNIGVRNSGVEGMQVSGSRECLFKNH